MRKTHPKGDFPTGKLFCKRTKNKNCSIKNDLAYMAVDVLDLLCIWAWNSCSMHGSNFIADFRLLLELELELELETFIFHCN